MGNRLAFLKDLSPSTVAKFNLIANPNEPSDATLNRILDAYIGLSCSHPDNEMFMKVALTPTGYMDVPETLTSLEELRQGKNTGKLLKVCKSCGHATPIKL